jgi:hypothetical protein
LLRSLQEIQPDFEEEAKAYAGLWSKGKKTCRFCIALNGKMFKNDELKRNRVRSDRDIF